MNVSLGPEKGLDPAAIAERVEAVLALAGLAEKVAMMSGRGFFESYRRTNGRWGAEPYRAGSGCERLGVPPLWFTDGPRGVARGNSTCFPVSMARGASFDPDLERRVGEVMGIEARAQGCTLSGAVCVNLLRHPAWGRAQETYGEDPYHVGVMGAALATGIQTHNVIATVKHFAVNSIENARFKVDVRVDERALREVWLPHFKRVLDAGCASVMSAYNRMNGDWCGHSRALLTDVLRGEWGFDGFVHSDWVKGVHDPSGAAAGLDVENPEPLAFGDRLIAAVEAGEIAPEVIDTACRRILSVQYRFACAPDPLESYDEALVASPAHTALAREAALKSAVLLTNDGVLPLGEAPGRVAVAGRLADLENTGDFGSSRVRPPWVVTALAGLRARFGEAAFVAGDEADPDAAARAAADAAAAVVVVGYTREDEGEYVPGDIELNEQNARKRGRPALGGDRASLRLPDAQVALIRAVAAAAPRTVVVIVAGSAVLIDEWAGEVSAVLQTFYAGMEGGTALAALLAGDVSPSGKLPFTVAAREEDYPFFDRNADAIEYGPWHGYALLDRENKRAAFPFGHGLSYARFAYEGLSARRVEGGLEARVTVRNAGDVEAEEVAQLYVGFPGVEAERPKKLLRGFRRVRIAPGEAREIVFDVPDADLAWWDPATRDWRVEPGPHRLFVGGSSLDAERLSAIVEV